jgi:hypothetical protein
VSPMVFGHASLSSPKAIETARGNPPKLRPPQLNSAQYEALTHVQQAEAAHILSGEAARPAAHWALPTIDLAASDKRLDDVREVASGLTNLMNDLDVEDGVPYDPVRHDASRYFVNAEQQAAQRKQMHQINLMLDAHVQRHEEAVQLLEMVNPDAADALDCLLDDLELKAIHTTRVAEFQVQSTLSALHVIGEQLEKKKPSKRSSVAASNDSSFGRGTSRLSIAADHGKASAIDAPVVEGQMLAASGFSLDTMHSPCHDEEKPLSLDDVPTTDWDDDELSEWYEMFVEMREGLEAELRQGQGLLERAREQIVELQMNRAKRDSRLERLPGARMNESHTQTDPTHEEAVKRELHKTIHTRDVTILDLTKQLAATEEKLGKLREPMPSRTRSAPVDDNVGERSVGATSPKRERSSKRGKARFAEGATDVSATARREGISAVPPRFHSGTSEKYLISGPQTKRKMHNVEAQTDGTGDEAAEQLRAELERLKLHSGDVNPAALDEQAFKYEQEIAQLRERFNAEQTRLEKKIQDLQASDSGRAISQLQQRIDKMRLGGVGMLSMLPMHIYAMARGDAAITFELSHAEMVDLDKRVQASAPPGTAPPAFSVSAPSGGSSGIGGRGGGSAAEAATVRPLSNTDDEIVRAVLDGVILAVAIQSEADAKGERQNALMANAHAVAVEKAVTVAEGRLHAQMSYERQQAEGERKKVIAEAERLAADREKSAIRRTNADANTLAVALREADADVSALIAVQQDVQSVAEAAEARARASTAASESDAALAASMVEGVRSQLGEALTARTVLLAELDNADSAIRDLSASSRELQARVARKEADAKAVQDARERGV